MYSVQHPTKSVAKTTINNQDPSSGQQVNYNLTLLRQASSTNLIRQASSSRINTSGLQRQGYNNYQPNQFVNSPNQNNLPTNYFTNTSNQYYNTTNPHGLSSSQNVGLPISSVSNYYNNKTENPPIYAASNINPPISTAKRFENGYNYGPNGLNNGQPGYSKGQNGHATGQNGFNSGQNGYNISQNGYSNGQSQHQQVKVNLVRNSSDKLRENEKEMQIIYRSLTANAAAVENNNGGENAGAHKSNRQRHHTISTNDNSYNKTKASTLQRANPKSQSSKTDPPKTSHRQRDERERRKDKNSSSRHNSKTDLAPKQKSRSLPRFPSDLAADTANLATLKRSVMSKSTHILSNLQNGGQQSLKPGGQNMPKKSGSGQVKRMLFERRIYSTIR